jgi:dolichol-phosphate mannosyltransferase
MVPGQLVVIPTFNEVSNIELMIDAVLAALPLADVLVVDDASPDGTAEVVDRVAARHGADRVDVLRRPGKAGLGTAYIEGFSWGIERGYEVLIQMDADFQHDPASLADLIAALARGADVAVGSRYVAGGSVPSAWPWRRKALSVAANLYARTALRLPVRDVTAGFRAHRRALLERMDIATIGADGYGFQIGLTHRAALAGARITEVPIRFGERTRGTSKMSLRIMIEAFRLVARLAIRSRVPPTPPG